MPAPQKIIDRRDELIKQVETVERELKLLDYVIDAIADEDKVNIPQETKPLTKPNGPYTARRRRRSRIRARMHDPCIKRARTSAQCIQRKGSSYIRGVHKVVSFVQRQA